MQDIPLADIRNDFLKKEIVPLNIKKGEMLIQQLEDACGEYDLWKSYKKASFTQTAD